MDIDQLIVRKGISEDWDREWIMSAILDRKGNIRLLDGCEILGYTDQYLGLNAFSFVHKDDLDQFKNAIETAIDSNQTTTVSYRAMNVEKGDRYQWMQTKFAPFRNGVMIFVYLLEDSHLHLAI